MIILYIVGGLIIIGIICEIWDALKAILEVAVGIIGAIGIVILIGWLYSLLGYPVWLIWLLVAVLIICNSVCPILYLVRKGKTIKTLRKEADISEEINCVEDKDIREKTKNLISEIMIEMQMATDKELYDEVKRGLVNIDALIDTLNKRKQELKERLKKEAVFPPKVKVIEQALVFSDLKDIFKEGLQKSVATGEIVVEAKLNGEDENVLSWDKKLYKSTKENPEPSNMLPPVHLEVD